MQWLLRPVEDDDEATTDPVVNPKGSQVAYDVDNKGDDDD